MRIRSLGFMTPVLAGLAAAAALSGCVVAPLGQPVAYQGGSAEVVYANMPPPAPQVEVVGVAPAPGYFWISGVWLWQGGRHVWHPGHWEAHRPGYQWTPHQWTPDGRGGWRMSGGYWAPRR